MKYHLQLRKQDTDKPKYWKFGCFKINDNGKKQEEETKRKDNNKKEAKQKIEVGKCADVLGIEIEYLRQALRKSCW